MQKPRAVVTVEVFAIGVPGQVAMQVRTSGLVELSDEEILTTLRSATELMEEKLHGSNGG